MRQPHPRTIAIGAFVLLLAAAPLVPRGGDDEGAITPSADRTAGPALATADTAGPGNVTPDLQAEIDRVVGEGRAVGRVSPRESSARLAAALVRCADFEGQRYCLGSGWTTDTQDEVQARAATAARTLSARRTATETTGDLDVLGTLQRTAALTPTQRATAERAELTLAARSVAKVWLLRHEMDGAPLPPGFLARHPEARATTTTGSARTVARTKGLSDYPRRDVVISKTRVAEQTRTYYCGPTTMQMIAWGWNGSRRSQEYWDDRLGTTSSGTGITDMVRVVNQATGWDRPGRAGTYVVLDVGDFSFAKWKLLLMRHITDYRAPLVLHPILLKKYYPYLDDDASGHFQVGRGYDKAGSKPTEIGYFEPWNQQRFDPSEPYIARVQWQGAYPSYRANLAHFQHNIGV